MVYHVYNPYSPKTTEERLRIKFAQESWDKYRGDVFDLFIKTEDTIPYFGWVIDEAVNQLIPDDIVVFTNMDTIFCPRTMYSIGTALASFRACESSRWDIRKPNWGVIDNCLEGKSHPGHDIFAFRVSWWHQIKERFTIPEMLLSYEAWDCALALMVNWTGNHRFLKPIVYHQMHNANWTRHRWEQPNKQNLINFFKWLDLNKRLESTLEELPHFKPAYAQLH